jgi:hypothetical protein
MTKKVKNLTQKDRFAEELLSIAPDVTENDRKVFMKKYKKGVTMVSNYLNGKVANVDTAAQMLLFFRGEIEKRNKILQNN